VVGVRALIDELIDDFFDRDRDRIRVIDDSDGASANIDEARVSLLLKNLVSNALRYSPEDSGPVELTIAVQGPELVLRVRDHGPGIPAAEAEHIGEPFYRGDPSRTRETGGTGLGLYLATLVARAHGGTLELLDTGEQGACFEARLPA
jgi:two-component system OmpR family sensor kinase